MVQLLEEQCSVLISKLVFFKHFVDQPVQPRNVYWKRIVKCEWKFLISPKIVILRYAQRCIKEFKINQDCNQLLDRNRLFIVPKTPPKVRDLCCCRDRSINMENLLMKWVSLHSSKEYPEIIQQSNIFDLQRTGATDIGVISSGSCLIVAV